MNASEAIKHLGCVDVGSVPFKNMIRALKILPRMNTPEERERLQAALWARRNRHEFEEACKNKREKRA